MALDSRQKRAAIIGVGRAWYRNSHPSGIDTAQRASIGQVYHVASFQEAVEAIVAVISAGRPPRAKPKKYKQVMIDGEIHLVNTPEQEFFLLNEFLAKSRSKYELDIVKKKSPIVKRNIRVLAKTIVRTENRIEKVSEELQWRRVIKQEDEDLLILLTA